MEITLVFQIKGACVLVSEMKSGRFFFFSMAKYENNNCLLFILMNFIFRVSQKLQNLILCFIYRNLCEEYHLCFFQPVFALDQNFWL